MAMWSSVCNDSIPLKEFSLELNVDYKTSGSWKGDYDHFCQKLGIIQCPSVVYGNISPSKSFVKLINRIIDLANWRAILLACAATGSMITEISLYNVELLPQHLSDLILALEKLAKIEVLRLDCLTLSNQPNVREKESHSAKEVHTLKRAQSAKVLVVPQNLPALLEGILGCNCTIYYISFRGNHLTDVFITSCTPILNHNFSIHALNLSENSITDSGAQELFQLLKFQPSLHYISLRKNSIQGSCLTQLAGLITGNQATPEDEHSFKTLQKSITDKNKLIKESNKKRKKLGIFELEEISPCEQRLIKIDKHGPHVVMNRSLHSVDLSYNPIPLVSISDMSSLMQIKSQDIQHAVEICSIDMYFKGIAQEETDIQTLRNLPVISGITLHCA